MDEVAWLIELGPKVSQTPTWYGRVDDEESGVLGWTADQSKVVRFARREDAQAVIDDIGWTEAMPVEHMWCAPAAPEVVMDELVKRLRDLERDLLPYSHKSAGSVRIDLNEVRAIVEAAARIEQLTAKLAEAEARAEAAEQVLDEVARQHGTELAIHEARAEAAMTALRGAENEACRGLDEGDYREALIAIKWSLRATLATDQGGTVGEGKTDA